MAYHRPGDAGLSEAGRGHGVETQGAAEPAPLSQEDNMTRDMWLWALVDIAVLVLIVQE